jgi:hypothetical protein
MAMSIHQMDSQALAEVRGLAACAVQCLDFSMGLVGCRPEEVSKKHSMVSKREGVCGRRCGVVERTAAVVVQVRFKLAGLGFAHAA